jgi:hypothetical protein
MVKVVVPPGIIRLGLNDNEITGGAGLAAAAAPTNNVWTKNAPTAAHTAVLRIDRASSRPAAADIGLAMPAGRLAQTIPRPVPAVIGSDAQEV